MMDDDYTTVITVSEVPLSTWFMASERVSLGLSEVSLAK